MLECCSLGPQAKQGRRIAKSAACGHTVGALKTMPKVCRSDTTSEATRLSHTQLMQMLIAAKPASILRSTSVCESSVVGCCTMFAVNTAAVSFQASAATTRLTLLSVFSNTYGCKYVTPYTPQQKFDQAITSDRSLTCKMLSSMPCLQG